MTFKNLFPVFLLAATMLAGTACNRFVVENVNYSHSIESVLTPDENGTVEDIRHGITFNVQPFEKQEFGEGDSASVDEIRLIRNASGFYYITAQQFKHVYVMKPGQGELKLKNKIKVSEEGLAAPAFNMRDGQVQLIKTETNQSFTLNEKGIQENSKKEEETKS
ncbi:hypothetical protein [Gracilimonas tropica]|uniref:hypothetical protein n=1 Tax=Gracilimonas tropica TaxID=454600 RepID=UPI0003A7090F|nr:hypothetical protein [Gracilimonas tropica]